MTSSSPLVSVIIPAFNAERFIGETIESVLTQTYSNYELIIVDDGSTDGQNLIIEKYRKEDGRISYYYQKNGGVSQARNFGFSKSKGEYIAFLDADDVWLSNNLELKVKKITTENVGLVHSPCHLIDINSRITEGVIAGREGNLLNAMLSWESCCVPGPSSALISREALEKSGLFDHNLSTAADFDIFIRIASVYKIGMISEVTWRYRVHPLNMHKNIRQMEKDNILVFHKAEQSGLFYDKKFKHTCYGRLYLILGLSWAKDGKNSIRGIYFLFRSLLKDYTVLLNYVMKKI